MSRSASHWGVVGVAFLAVGFCTVRLVRSHDSAGIRGVSALAQAAEQAAVRIEAALGEKTEVDFVDTPLSDMIDYLKTKHKIQIQLDKKSLADAGVAEDTPITRSLRGTTLASALDLILGDFDLAFVPHDEVLLITSRSRAARLVSIKVYPVVDLVLSEDQAQDEEFVPDYDGLVESVAAACEAAQGDESCEPQIRAFPSAGSLIVTAAYDCHSKIRDLLDSLRAAQRAQPGVRPVSAEKADAKPAVPEKPEASDQAAASQPARRVRLPEAGAAH